MRRRVTLDEAREPGQFQHFISTTTRLLLYYLIAEEDFCVNKTLVSRPSGKTDQETLASVVHSPWLTIWSWYRERVKQLDSISQWILRVLLSE